MKIDVTKLLTQYDGTPIKDRNHKGEMVDVEVRQALISALIHPVETDKPIDKFNKDVLARKIFGAENEVELTAEEAVLLKERVGEYYTPLVVGQLWRLLDS
jgi:hypothetical protein